MKYQHSVGYSTLRHVSSNYKSWFVVKNSSCTTHSTPQKGNSNVEAHNLLYMCSIITLNRLQKTLRIGGRVLAIDVIPLVQRVVARVLGPQHLIAGKPKWSIREPKYILIDFVKAAKAFENWVGICIVPGCSDGRRLDSMALSSMGSC